jgi:hypothetical protein
MPSSANAARFPEQPPDRTRFAERKQLIGIEEIDGITYLRLSRPDPEQDEEEQD